MKRNRNEEMKAEIAALGGRRPELLLHCCCGPCATAVVERLSPHFSLTLFYFNPNTYPREEYERRLASLQKFAEEACPETRLIVGEYDPGRYERAVAGIENAEEGGPRCAACVRMRLEETARAAAAGGFEYFCTTLSVSPMKNADAINEAGEALSSRYGTRFLPSDFKKENGFARSAELSALHGLYRQDYCGCRVSRERRKGNG